MTYLISLNLNLIVQNLVIKDANGKQSIKYFFADKSVAVAPTKTINMPDKYVTFTLSKDNLAKLMRGVNTLNLTDIAVKGDGKELSIVAVDKKTPSNDYSISLGETDKKFTAYFKTENMKMLPDDYDVAISQQKYHTLALANQLSIGLLLNLTLNFRGRAYE